MMVKICPNCKSEYRMNFSTCSDCNVELIEMDKKEEVNWLKGFGEIPAKKCISILFYLGILPLFYSTIIFGRYIYLSNKYLKDIWFLQDGKQAFTQTEVNNLPLGVFLGILFFIFGILIWKIICELLIIIFRCFEVYVEKNSSNQ